MSSEKSSPGTPPMRVRSDSHVSEKIELTVEEINDSARKRTSMIDILKEEKTMEAKEAAEIGKQERHETIQEREERMRREEMERAAEKAREGREHAEMNKSTRTMTAKEKAEEERRRMEERRKSLDKVNDQVSKASNWAKEELAMRDAEKAAAVKKKLDKAASLARNLEETRMDGMSRFQLQKAKLDAIEREEEERMQKVREKAEAERRKREEERILREQAEAEERERLRKKKEEEERRQKEEEERMAKERQEAEWKRIQEEEAIRRKEEEERRRKAEEEDAEKQRLLKLRMDANKSGFLGKKGGSKRDDKGNSKLFSRRNWNNRFFFLDGSTSTLTYYKEQFNVSTDIKYRPTGLGSFYLPDCTITSTSASGKPNCISIHTQRREGFVISCSSADDCTEWLEALTLHATNGQGYTENGNNENHTGAGGESIPLMI